MPFNPTAFIDGITALSAAEMNKLGTQFAQAVAELTAKMHATTGHKHTGVSGEGPVLALPYASGVYSDTTTVIPGGGSHTIDIEIGANRTKVMAHFKSQGTPSKGAVGATITCTSTSAESVATMSYAGQSLTRLRAEETVLVQEIFETVNGYIDMQDCFIVGTKLRLVFFNHSGSIAGTLKLTKFHWTAF